MLVPSYGPPDSSRASSSCPILESLEKKKLGLPGSNQRTLSVHRIVLGEHRLAPSDRVIEGVGSGGVHVGGG